LWVKLHSQSVVRKLIDSISLLNSLFHTDRVHDKFKVLENFWLMALDKALHCLIG